MLPIRKFLQVKKKKPNTKPNITLCSQHSGEWSSVICLGSLKLAILLAACPRVFLLTYSLELDGKEAVSHFQGCPSP